ncbi:MAG: hypothetical protein V1837_05945 [Candidatus Woesearchaeota archaeon]
MNAATGFLKPKGKIIMVFSSLTNQERINRIIKANMMEYKQLEEQHIFFESIYVYLAYKSQLLNQLEAKGVRAIKYLAQGKRGVVYTGVYKGTKVAIKTKKAGSKAEGAMANEARMLKAINKQGIGPRFRFSGKEYLVYEFVEGEFFIDFIGHKKRAQIVKVIREIFSQLYKLDQMHINKEEMSRPRKHIIVGNDRAVLIDFERARKTEKPSNVTQFCSFLISNYIASTLKKQGINIDRERLIRAAQSYKEKLDKGSWSSVLHEIDGTA